MVKTIYSIDARVYKVCSQEYIKCVIKSIYSHDIRVSILLNIHFSASESSTQTFDYQHIAFSQKKKRTAAGIEDTCAGWRTDLRHGWGGTFGVVNLRNTKQSSRSPVSPSLPTAFRQMRFFLGV